jgi:hypothetical protein
MRRAIAAEGATVYVCASHLTASVVFPLRAERVQ